MTREPREALVAWRASIPYTQHDVAALFKVSRQGVCNWERGLSQVPARVQALLRREGWLTTAHTRYDWLPADDRRLADGVAAGISFARLTQAFGDAGRPRSKGALRQRLHRLRQQAGEPRRRPPPVHHGPGPNVWTAEQDAWLIAHAGEAPLPELARRITAACGIPRTACALHRRLCALHISRQSWHLTGAEVGYYCGVSSTTVRKWIARGWLQLPAWAARTRRYGAATIPAEAVHTFIDTYAVHLQLAQMPPSLYRDRAAAIWARERWLDTDTAARYAGLTPGWIRKLIYDGQIPAIRANRQGAHVWWMIRARDLAAFLKNRRVAGVGA